MESRGPDCCFWCGCCWLVCCMLSLLLAPHQLPACREHSTQSTWLAGPHHVSLTNARDRSIHTRAVMTSLPDSLTGAPLVYFCVSGMASTHLMTMAFKRSISASGKCSSFVTNRPGGGLSLRGTRPAACTAFVQACRFLHSSVQTLQGVSLCCHAQRCASAGCEARRLPTECTTCTGSGQS